MSPLKSHMERGSPTISLARFDEGLVWYDKGFAPSRGWASVLIDKDSFSDWYDSAAGPMADVEEKERDRGGRPPDYDWAAIKEYALAVVKERGDAISH